MGGCNYVLQQALQCQHVPKLFIYALQMINLDDESIMGNFVLAALIKPLASNLI
jgi:hypothetical protein